MTTRIEAKRLSGVDLGKAVTVTERAKFGLPTERTGSLISVRHYNDRTDVLMTSDRGPYPVALEPGDVIAIDGIKP